LSFTYEFSGEDDFVYLAYCIPYSYSYLMHRLIKLQSQCIFVDVDTENYSTGGLSIPIVKIGKQNDKMFVD